jgi:hypothetical protein
MEDNKRTNTLRLAFVGRMYEFNFANVVNYGELAHLMAPRPFMVERGHEDGADTGEVIPANPAVGVV